jgi:small subunit ribosomal protein S1
MYRAWRLTSRVEAAAVGAHAERCANPIDGLLSSGFDPMADAEVNPHPSRSGPAPDPNRGRTAQEAEDAIDAALAAASKDTAADPRESDIPLKRQWDSGMEAELEAAMMGFDPGTFSVVSPRSVASGRPRTAEGDRGQESRPGLRSGKVIRVRGNNIFVDLGGKSEGVLPVNQFESDLPEQGSVIEVYVDRFDHEEGVQVLRLKGAAIEADWDNLRKGVIVQARGTKTIKGGLEVDVDGIRGFMPISQIDLSRVDDAAAYVNQKFKAIVTEVNSRERNLVISRRELLERERAELRERTWATLAEGQVHDAVVRSIKDFGVFVDLGGVDGLLPIGEMSWSRISKAEELVKVGDQVKVKVLKIDPVARKLTLGLKQLTPSPWETAAEKYPRGTMAKGRVSKLMEFGAFVELEPGVEGLIHISELFPTRVRRVADIVKLDQEVEVRILKVEPEARRIALSLLPAAKGIAPVPDEDEEDDADEAPPPEPEPKVPLKGGLGDRERKNR